jgi:hypothetical protein
MAKRLTILAVLLLVPYALFASPATTPAPNSSVAACPAAAAPAAVDFGTWLKNQDQAPKAAASCGPNFCTQQQKTQCNQQCGTRFHVGLQCCSNCTTICNCGSRPINC